jgi:hypothetical protein
VFGRGILVLPLPIFKGAPLREDGVQQL